MTSDGKGCRDWRPLIRSRWKCVLKQNHEWKAQLPCYLGGIWRRLEPLERIYGRFPSVDPSGRFAGVFNLGKPYIDRENRLQYNPLNGHKSAHGPHRRDVTSILCKVISDNLTEMIGFFLKQILIFRMLRNNADVRRYSYFELGLPVVPFLSPSRLPRRLAGNKRDLFFPSYQMFLPLLSHFPRSFFLLEVFWSH